MLKVDCNNPVCGETYYFNDEKFPNATKVKCPKCGQVQARPSVSGAGSGASGKREEEESWFQPPSAGVSASPQLDFDTPAQQHFIADPPPSVEEEDFSAPVKKATPKEEPVRPTPRATPLPQQPTPSVRPSVDAIGWLVIHDEFTESRTFALRKGLNRIGRASDSTPKDVNIGIETRDQYMSRHHCDIEVRQKLSVGGYEYILSDRDYSGKKASANGTFLNARKRLTPMDESVLQDGDTVQVGRTKLVLKLPAFVPNSQAAAESVRQNDFFQTIIN